MNSCRKGKRVELAACEAVRDIWPDVKRSAMQGRGGHEQPDLLNTPGWWCEVGGGNVNPASKWEQAFRDWDHGDDLMDPRWQPSSPLALTRRDRKEWLITMSLDAFKALVRK